MVSYVCPHFPVPGQPRVNVISETATTITVFWSVPSGSVVESYEVVWETNGSITITDGHTSHIITGLEADSNYIITVTATNAAGSAASDAVTGRTLKRGS